MKNKSICLVFCVLFVLAFSIGQAQSPPGFGEPTFVQVIDIGKKPKIFIVKVSTLETTHLAFQTESGPSEIDSSGIVFFDISLSPQHLDELIYALQKVQAKIKAHRLEP